jgi:hypothetical protein
MLISMPRVFPNSYSRSQPLHGLLGCDLQSIHQTKKNARSNSVFEDCKDERFWGAYRFDPSPLCSVLCVGCNVDMKKPDFPKLFCRHVAAAIHVRFQKCQDAIALGGGNIHNVRPPAVELLEQVGVCSRGPSYLGTFFNT